MEAGKDILAMVTPISSGNHVVGFHWVMRCQVSIWERLEILFQRLEKKRLSKNFVTDDIVDDNETQRITYDEKHNAGHPPGGSKFMGGGIRGSRSPR